LEITLNRKTLFALFTLFALCTAVIVPATVAAAPSFTFTPDDQGANDEPGQKDLTAQSSAQDPVAPNHFFTAWKWDDTSWSGNNTGDGCSLFDTDTPDGNGLVDYALCATVKGGVGPALVTINTVSLYSCNDLRADRCSGPTLLFASTSAAQAGTLCTVTDNATGQFGGTDTQIACDISAIAALATPPITVVGSGTLLNTCSYPSREPNSDPSDCVLTVAPTTVTTTTTTPTGSATFTATLNDSAQVSPAAPGNVVFKLFSDSTCTTQIFTATVATDATGAASTTTSVSAAGTYEWTADFTPTDPTAFDPSSSPCGDETVTVTAATVS
jgi:hypothetical protein